MNEPGTAAWSEVPLHALLFLCFFQLLTDFVASVYAFGLLQTSVPREIACLTLLFAPVVLLFFREVTTGFLVLTGGVMLLSRVASLALDTRGQMWTAGIGTAAFLVWFPARLWRLGNERDACGGSKLGMALALATLLQIFLRALNSGNDFTGFGGGRYLGGALAFGAGVLLCIWGRKTAGKSPTEPTSTPTVGTRGMAGICVGMTGTLVLLYFGLAVPTVMARWTDSDYLWGTALTGGTTTMFLALWPRVFGSRLNSGALLCWNLLFLAVLGIALWSSRVPFPADARAYPFPEPPVGALGRIGLPLMLLLSPILYVNFARLAGAVAGMAPSVRALGGGFTAGSVCLLLLVLAQVFTTVYDYIPAVGPWFRDRFWLVLLVAGASAVLPVLLLRPKPDDDVHAAVKAGATPAIAAGTALALGAIGAVALTRAHPKPSIPDSALRLMTFNLQQGYSPTGAKNFTRQLELIRQVNPDILGLQETDTARVAGGNSDLVRFLADRLNCHVHPGPRTGAGTFGIALLSRFPIERTRTFYLTSRGEQTAVLAAEIRAGGTRYHVFVTHLGNGGPLVQQQETLDLVAGDTNVILMGDFNFRPGTEPYVLTSKRLEDAWLTAGERRVDPPDQNVNRRIDHVFVSPGMPIARATYLDRGVSDHPAMVIELGRSR